MPNFTCLNPGCSIEFYSKHTTAKYCTRKCAGLHSITPEARERQRTQLRKYTDEQLIELLRDQARELGRTPSRREVKPAESTYRRRFGTLLNALALAGLPPAVGIPKQYIEHERHTIQLSTRFAVLERDGFRCQYCGGTPQDGYVLHVDHVIPRSKGGSDETWNLKTACSLCNLGKSNTISVAA